MSIISYGEGDTKVTLPDAFITQFSQEAMYDDVGDTDWYCTKFDIKVQGILNASFLPILVPDLATSTSVTSAADLMDIVRSRLLQPRKKLSMKFNTVELIPQPPEGNAGTVDAQNGPKPQSCVIAQLTNTTFLLTYHIIAHYWENNKVEVITENKISVKNQPGNNTLFNRWSETTEIDELNLTRRTRRGKFLIRSDNSDGKIAHEVFQQMAVVSVPVGFLRKASRYTVLPGGLAVEYEVVDQEVYRMPPPPAFKASGYYRESAVKNLNNLWWAEVNVRLDGDKNTNQADLVDKAIKIASGKILQRQQTNVTFFLTERASVEVGLYENYAICNMRALGSRNEKRVAKPVSGLFDNRPADKKGSGDNPIASFADINVETPEGEFQYKPKFPTNGTKNLFIQAAAYYDPSLKKTKVDEETSQLTAGTAPGAAGKFKEKLI